MIVTKFVKVPVNSKTKKYYLDLGYIDVDGFFFINVDHLTKSSHSLVESICDYCYSVREISYKEYNRNISFNNKFSCSNKCGSLKKKELSILRYGVDSPSKLDHIKDKSKKTNLERYGCEEYMKTDDFKEKSTNSKLKRYGRSNLMSLDDIKDRIKKTNLEKYGVENVFQSDEIKFKIRKSNLEKYGYEYYCSTQEYRDKYINTNLDRYGVDHPMKLDLFFEKVKKTNFDKYGSYYMSTSDFKDRSRKTNLEKYGVEYPTMSELVKEKIRLTNLLNLGVEYPMMSEIVRDKSKKTNLKKYGREYVSQSEKIRKKYMNCMDEGYMEYDPISKNSIYRCNVGHKFQIKSDNYLSRLHAGLKICTVCNPIGDSTSIMEKELFEFIGSIYSGEIVQSYRDDLEIDIYLPGIGLGFEFNGLYWHSERYKDRKYHLNKTNHFKERGIRIIHIWEDDWIYRGEIVKSQIIHLIGKSNRILARKCEIFEIDASMANKFLDENHIQGSVVSVINLALIYEDKIVCVMSFNNLEGRKRMSENEWCLSRYCNLLGSSVVGGASKCLSYFLKKYSPTRIVSYSDKNWSIGSMYPIIGFSFISDSQPDYKYLYEGIRVNKSRFRKSEIKRKFNCDISNISNISESEFLFSKGIYKIFDCGKTKFEWVYKK